MTTIEPGKVYSLPAVMDSTFARKLHADILTMRGAPVNVDAGSVERVSTLCLQVLLSAARTWQAEGLGFSVDQPSDSMKGAFKLLGMENEYFAGVA
jgi:chemotaxis protein CheX